MCVAHVEIIIAVHTRAHDRRRAHHRHATSHHSHLEVGPRNIFTQERLRFRVDPVLRYDTSRKFVANDLRVAWANGSCRIEIRIRMRAERVVDRGAAHLEVAVYLILSRHGGDHCFRPRMPQAFVVEKEKALIANDWATKGTAAVVAHKMI